jgi:opacity protein-like surface antigen
MEVGDGLELFARVGFAESKLKATLVGEFSNSDSDNDVSFGVGMKYAFSKSMYGVVDYMRYYNKDDVKVDGFTFGLGYKF